MSEKKKHKREEKVEEGQAEAVAMPEFNEQVQAESEAWRRQLEEAEAKLAESVDGWQRTQADFQNYKRRIERDQEMIYTAMKGDVLKRVLPALDDLELALQNRPPGDAWANGIELVARKLQNLLDAEGLKKIEAKGAAFDPNFHEAISHEPADDVESGRVIDVVRNGYMLGERVIRPALVRVAQ